MLLRHLIDPQTTTTYVHTRTQGTELLTRGWRTAPQRVMTVVQVKPAATCVACMRSVWCMLSAGRVLVAPAIAAAAPPSDTLRGVACPYPHVYTLPSTVTAAVCRLAAAAVATRRPCKFSSLRGVAHAAPSGVKKPSCPWLCEIDESNHGRNSDRLN